MAKGKEHNNRLWWMASAVVLLFVAAAVVPVAAYDVIFSWSDVKWNTTYVPIANPPPRFDSTPLGNPYYFINLTNSTGGMNALHITNCNASDCFAGGVYEDRPLSGTFYVSDTGGKGCEDDILLLVSVNETYNDGTPFNITITAKGYNWTPRTDGALPLESSVNPANSINYHNPSTTGIFNALNYLQNATYGVPLLKEWKFAPTEDYPVYNGQVMEGAGDPYFNHILIDLKAGVIGNQTKNKTSGEYDPTYYANLTDFGMVNVSYTITGINNSQGADLVAFNVYAYNNKTIKQQPGSLPPAINWLNRVRSSGDPEDTIYSGWLVGTP